MTTTVSISPTRVILGGGKFDTNNDYVRTDASGVAMAEGPTWYVTLSGNNGINWRWSTGLNAKSFAYPGDSAPTTNPSYVRVTV